MNGSFTNRISSAPYAWSPQVFGPVAVWLRGDDPGAVRTLGIRSVLQSLPNRGDLGGVFEAPSLVAPERVLSMGMSCAEHMVGRRLVSSLPASSWGFLQDEDCTVSFVFTTYLTSGDAVALATTSTPEGDGVLFGTTTASRNLRAGAEEFDMTVPCNHITRVSFVLSGDTVLLYTDGVFRQTKTRAESATIPEHSLTVGASFAGSNSITGVVHEVLIHRTALGASAVGRLHEHLGRWGEADPPLVVAAVGNSLTAGRAYTEIENIYVQQLERMLPPGSRVDNWGHGSYRTTQLTALIPTEPMLSLPGEGERVLLVWELLNDLASGATPEEAIGHYEDYILAVRGAGWTAPILLATNGPATSVSSTLLNDANAILRTDWASIGADGLVDLADDPALAVPVMDGVHYGKDQNTVVANYFYQAISQL